MFLLQWAGLTRLAGFQSRGEKYVLEYSLTYRAAARNHRRSLAVTLAVLGAVLAGTIESAEAHVFIARFHRVGAYPTYDGNGWVGEAFLNVPNYDLAHHAVLQGCLDGPDVLYKSGCRAGDLDRDGDVDLGDVARFQGAFYDSHLLRARRLIEDRAPDFTFRTDWIDFPAGPMDSDRDANFQTVGDFLNDYIYDVSDPSKLDEPFGALFLRFTGFIKITLEDEVRVQQPIGLPVWIDVGTLGFDGFQVRVGEVMYRFPNVRWAQPFFNWGPAVEVLGLFPIEIIYLNIHDPEGKMGNERAGIEVYSWHGGGLELPAGQQMIHETRGPATVLPPRVIYQEADVRPLAKGDFDADYDIDLRDFQWYQGCADPEFYFLPSYCKDLDFDDDGDLDSDDFTAFHAAFRGPGAPSGDGYEP